jgi:hypothetical protein
VVGGDADVDDEVPRRAARLAGLSLAPQLDDLPVGDPGGDAGLDLLVAHREGRLDAVDGVDEVEGQVGADVAAGHRAGGPAPAEPGGPGGASALAEEPAEQVAEVEVAQVALGEREGLPTAPERATAAEAAALADPGTGLAGHPSELVVLLAGGRVPEDLLGPRRRLEPLLGGGVTGFGVGMVLPGQLLVRLLDLRVGGLGADAQYGVEIGVEPVLLRSHS